jgi:hypothetical protein
VDAKRPGGGGRRQLPKNEVHHVRQAIPNIRGFYPQSLQSELDQGGVPSPVPVAPSLVRTAIDLHRQAASQANEVEVVAKQRVLAAEMKPFFRRSRKASHSRASGGDMAFRIALAFAILAILGRPHPVSLRSTTLP